MSKDETKTPKIAPEQKLNIEVYLKQWLVGENFLRTLPQIKQMKKAWKSGTRSRG